jgi:hypothetical protein
VSLLGAAATLLWALVLVWMPDGVGEALLGDTWEGARSLIPLVAAQATAIAVATGVALALKAMSRTGALLHLSLMQAALALGLGAAGALVAATPGALSGLLAAQVIGALATVMVLRVAVRRDQAGVHA